MSGETPHGASTWYDTEKPGVFLDTRFLDTWDRIKRLGKMAGICMTNVIARLPDEEVFADIRALNQRILDQHPEAGAPNPPRQE